MAKRLQIAIEDKTYVTPEGALPVLLDCHLCVEPGELYVLLGASGSGKTTLLRLILGLDRGFQGTITLGDKVIQHPGPDRGMVFQEPRLLPWLSVRKNVEFACSRRERRQGVARRRAQEMLDLVGLQGFERRWPRELSGGMAQRAALARALVNIPDLLLMDEPFGALDTHMRARLQDELLAILDKTGITALLITHDIDEALYLGDRIGVLSSGPGGIRASYSVDVPRPRARNDERLLRLRATLIEELFQQ